METQQEMEGKAQVHYQSWQETYQEQLSESYLRDMSYEKCLAIARRWPDHVLVAKDGDRVIGFTAYGNCRDAGMDEYGEVMAIYLLAEYQKQGIGYRLMQSTLEHMPKHQKFVLWVLKGNQKAIGFYERFGFSFDGCEKNLLIGTHVTEQRMIYQR